MSQVQGISKKISDLDPLAVLSLEDEFPIVPIGSAETYKANLHALKAAIQGTDFGSELFFSYGVPSAQIGRNIDVYFDLSTSTIYQKISGSWAVKTQFEKKSQIIIFITVADNSYAYGHPNLKGATLQHLFIDGFRISTGFVFDPVQGTISWTPGLNKDCRVEIIYS
ncbi:MAG: hypothetical protein ABIU30_18570 [Ferruginibacter sp.]